MITLLKNIRSFVEKYSEVFTYAKFGLIAGWIITFIIRYAIDYAFFRDVMNDGLFVLIYLPLIPVGAFLGAAVGVSVLLVKKLHLVAASIICVVAGLLVAIPFGDWASSYPKQYLWEVSGFMLPAAFGFLVVAVGVVISMIHLINQTRWD